MNRTLSAYLDIVRFTMAFAVFFYHSSFPIFMPWLPWINVGHHAVIAFFVLSGFVITLVTETREVDARAYVRARLSRVYSVLLPVVLLSCFVFYVGRNVHPAVYAEATIDSWQRCAQGLASNLFMLNQLWFLSVPTFANTPIWSLCYEFWIYILFGAYRFISDDYRRFVAVVSISLIIGPKILLLLPVWWAGRWLYFEIQNRTYGLQISCLLFVLPILTYLIGYATGADRVVTDFSVELLGGRIYELGWSHQFVYDYWVGVLVCCNFIGAHGLACARPKLLSNIATAARWAASYTFTLYLAHYPLLHFFAAVYDHDPLAIIDGLVLWVSVMASVFLLGYFTENKRAAFERFIAKLV